MRLLVAPRAGQASTTSSASPSAAGWMLRTPARRPGPRTDGAWRWPWTRRRLVPQTPPPGGPRSAAHDRCARRRRAAITHHSARSLEEAAELLGAAPGAARAVAGGTDLLGLIKDRVHERPPETLVDLKTIAGLDGIEERDGALSLGTLARLSELERRPLVRERYRALAQAAHAIASPQLRNMGTVGGNIAQEPRCWYYRAADDAFDCTRKGGRYCNAFTGDSRFHSIAGSMKVDTRPWTAACPGAVEIPEYMELLRAGDADGAARRLLARNPLPAVTGRVCPHTCEDECNRGSSTTQSRCATSSATWATACWTTLRCSVPPRRPVASQSRWWARARRSLGRLLPEASRARRHRVRAGRETGRHAALRHPGLPALTGDRGSRRRIPGDARRGASLRRGAGRGTTLDQLRADHDAVFLATGAWALPRIGLEGEDELPAGLDFLKGIAEGDRRAPGPRVLVIGGGSVAMDVAVSARRLGAEQVTVACLETCDEMPALLEEVEDALAEGIELEPSCGPARLFGVTSRSWAWSWCAARPCSTSSAASRPASMRATARRWRPTR